MIISKSIINYTGVLEQEHWVLTGLHCVDLSISSFRFWGTVAYNNNVPLLYASEVGRSTKVKVRAAWEDLASIMLD